MIIIKKLQVVSPLPFLNNVRMHGCGNARMLLSANYTVFNGGHRIIKTLKYTCILAFSHSRILAFSHSRILALF